MSRSLGLACLVMPEVPWDVGANLERVERLARTAAARGADLIVTPEAVLNGYCIRDFHPSYASGEPVSAADRQRYAATAQVWPDDPALRRLASLAGELGVHLICGGIERAGDALYNAAFLFGPGGPIGRYHKVHIWWEHILHSPGDSAPVFELPWGKIGIVICFDRRFPELTRAMCLAGAQMLVVPNDGTVGEINDHMLITRAYENAAYVAFNDPKDSFVVSPEGRVIARSERLGTEEIVSARVDLDRVLELRGRDGSHLSQRRPQAYSGLL